MHTHSHSKLLSLLCTLCLLVRNSQSTNVVPNTPAAGTVVQAYQPYNVTWNPSYAGTASSVYIGIGGYDNSLINLTDSTPNNGTWLWTPSGFFSGSDNYYLSICPIGDTVDGCGVTFNGRFSIASSSSSPSSSATSSSSSVSSQSVTATSTPSTQSSNPNAKGSHGISVGDIVAICIVVPVVVFAIAALSFYLWTKHQARQSANLKPERNGAVEQQEIAELSGHGRVEMMAPSGPFGI